MGVNFLSQCRMAVSALIVFTIITGLMYPLAVLLVARSLFPGKANGSLLTRGSCVVGSELIGQQFNDLKYFWGRPSATSPFPYNAAASSGSNLGPTNPALTEVVSGRIQTLRAAHPGNPTTVPADLATASGSGLDPHITPRAVEYQIERVANARGIPVDEVKRIVREHVEKRTWGILGEERVNVLELNLALDKAGIPHGE